MGGVIVPMFRDAMDRMIHSEPDPFAPHLDNGNLLRRSIGECSLIACASYTRRDSWRNPSDIVAIKCETCGERSGLTIDEHEDFTVMADRLMEYVEGGCTVGKPQEITELTIRIR